MNDREEIKRKILKQALVHVPFDGWSQGILEQAAGEIGVDPSFGWRLFPRGVGDAIDYWSHLLDQEMLEALPSPEDLRVREKVALAVRTRISLLIPVREAARKTSLYLAKPHHVGQATRLLYQTVNEIWYYAGDQSTDYNFYTKRGLLSWVYSTTFLYWLRDHSEGYEKTWSFLNRRIDEVLTLPKVGRFIFPWRRHG